MAKATLKEISKYMKGIDFCMLTTTSGAGKSESRPMSNNGDVTYDGTSYFFSDVKTKKVRDIQKNSKVSLQFVNTSLFKKNVFISVVGQAKIVTDRAEMEKHWVPSLNLYFKDGLDTRGVSMIVVKAKTIEYWRGQEEGEFKTRSKSK